jgi:hypothetical protein
MLHTLRFFFQNAVYFIMVPFFGSCIIRILHTGCAKNLNAKFRYQKVNIAGTEAKAVGTTPNSISPSWLLRDCSYHCEHIASYNTIIIIIIGSTGSISKSFRKYVSTVPGNHDVRELQKTAISGTAHRLRKVLM